MGTSKCRWCGYDWQYTGKHLFTNCPHCRKLTPVKPGVREIDFAAYENVKQSGVINMLDVKAVAKMAGITEGMVKCIIMNYDDLKAEFMDKEKNIYIGV